MTLIRYLPIVNVIEATQQMREVGMDGANIELMKDKTVHINLRVEGIEPRIANLLRQEMLSLGADAALNAKGLDCSVPQTDAILMGNLKQFDSLVTKLGAYPHLLPLGQSVKETLENLSKTHYSIRCRERTLRLGERTLLMGVLNVTPDSFSDGGLYFERDKAVAHGIKMVEQGADLIDVGGESTRPGSKPLDLEEELRRVLPVIESLSREVDVPVSIDTYKSAVAERALEAGAQMVNDISGLHYDPRLGMVVARARAPLVVMHIRGTPETMQRDVRYDSLFSEVLQYLRESIGKAESSGIEPQQIIIDPGIGFGKTLENNLLLIKNLQEFRVLGKPILLGTSRKSFIGKILQEEVQHRLEGTLATIVAGVLNGASIIRCHDVPEAKKAITVADAIRSVGSKG